MAVSATVCQGDKWKSKRGFPGIWGLSNKAEDGTFCQRDRYILQLRQNILKLGQIIWTIKTNTFWNFYKLFLRIGGTKLRTEHFVKGEILGSLHPPPSYPATATNLTRMSGGKGTLRHIIFFALISSVCLFVVMKYECWYFSCLLWPPKILEKLGSCFCDCLWEDKLWTKWRRLGRNEGLKGTRKFFQNSETFPTSS